MLLVWSACADVSNSGFVDHQSTCRDFADLVARFLDPTTFIPAERKEELPLFMPAEFPHAGKRRIAANVLRVHTLVLDFDKGSDAELEAALGSIQQYGFITYTSFSHDPNGQAKFRAIVKLSRPVDITEWSKFFPRALGALGVEKIADLRCADACHMYYVPGGDRTKYVPDGRDGPGLDVDVVLSMSLPAGLEEAKQRNYVDVLEPEDRGEVDDGLKLVWEAKLSCLADEVAAAPYPGPVYGLTNGATFGIARGVPHIVSEDRVRKTVRSALDLRYSRHLDDPAVERYRIKSYRQVDKAIADGMSQPWWPPKVDEVLAHPLTDFGLRERLLERYHRDLAFESTWGKWLTWNERHWNLEAGDALVQEKMVDAARRIVEERDAHALECWRLKELYEGVKDDPNTSDDVKAKAEHELDLAQKRLDKLDKFAEKAQHVQRVGAGISLASSDERVLSSYSEFNTNPWILNFLNGTLDLKTGELREHRREDKLTRIVPHELREMPTPHFDRFLIEFADGDQELVAFLWRLFGYTAIGITSEQVMIILHGDGANGKSTLLRLLLEAFGHGPNGYGHAAQSSNLLTHKGGEQHATWRMSMFGKRCVVCQEVEEGKTLAESQLKELTGNDLVTGRKMRQDEWSYAPEFTPWLGCNSLPHVRGIDEGIWRRFIVIHCRASFKGREDRTMFEKLKAELPGIWHRIAKEAVLYRAAGKLVLPEAVKRATEDYRIEQDPLRDFFEKWCVVGEKDTFVARANLWNAYDEHCQETRQRVFHERKRFYAAVEKTATILKNVFAEHKREGVRGFIHLRLKDPKERVDASPRVQLQKAFEAESAKQKDSKN